MSQFDVNPYHGYLEFYPDYDQSGKDDSCTQKFFSPHFLFTPKSKLCTPRSTQIVVKSEKKSYPPIKIIDLTVFLDYIDHLLCTYRLLHAKYAP